MFGLLPLKVDGGILISIYKEGDKEIPDKGVTLLNIFGKLFTRIINNG